MLKDYTETIVLISSLQSGKEKEIEAKFPASFLEVNEKELTFTESVNVKGKVYLAGDALIFHFSASVSFSLPCKVCNTNVNSELEVKNVIHAEDIEDMEGDRFNYANALREALLLELPDIIECSQGVCPERAHIKKYLKEERKEDGNSEMSYHPFSSL
jgi:uncharacterized metal-binding protein YceD (DUF177 family)